MARKDIPLLVSAAGWIAGMIDRLVPALRQAGISDEEIHALVAEKKGEELLGIIVDAVAEAVKRVKNFYSVRVDYAAEIEDMVVRGKYDWSNDNITSDHFPANTAEEADIAVQLVHFNRSISSDGVIVELDRMGLRPAEARELLAFGVKYPDVQREFPIIALGSVWLDRYGDRRVVCLCSDSGDRRAVLGWFGRVWGACVRFAAVRK